MKTTTRLFVFIALLMTPVAARAVPVSNLISGSWSNPLIWFPSPPTAADDVTITVGTTVDFDVTTTVLSLTVNGTLQYENSAARSLTVTNNVTVGILGVFTVGATGTQTHALAVAGTALTNNGQVDFRVGSAVCNTTMVRTTTSDTQTLNGSGTLFDFNDFTMENTVANSPAPPTFDVFTFPATQTIANQNIGQSGGASISFANLTINNVNGQARSRAFFTQLYAEDNRTAVFVNLDISSAFTLLQGVVNFGAGNSTALSHSIGAISIGSAGSVITPIIQFSTTIGTITNTGFALCGATDAFTTLTVLTDITSPVLSLPNSAALGITNPLAVGNAGGNLIVNGDVNIPMPVAVIGNGSLSSGFPNGLIRFTLLGDIRITSSDSRFSGRNSGGGYVPEFLMFGGTSAAPSEIELQPVFYLGTTGETNARCNWIIQAGTFSRVLNGSAIGLMSTGFVTINGTLIVDDGGQLLCTQTGGGGPTADLFIGETGTIRFVDPDGLGDGTLLDPSANAPVLTRRSAPGEPTPPSWNLSGTQASGTIEYAGTATQILTPRNSTTVSGTQTYNRLVITGGAKTLAGDAVTDSLTLTSGIVAAGTNAVSVASTEIGAITGGSAASYINGTLVRAVTNTGTPDYFYPVGDAEDYRPITLNNIGTGSGTIAAREIKASPRAAGGSFVPAPEAAVDPAISDIRYWQLTRTGTPQPSSVRLDYDVNDAAPTPATLRVGQGGTLGGVYNNQGRDVVASSSSFITSDAALVALLDIGTAPFFSLATLNLVDNPLPVELLSFSAAQNQAQINLTWQTGSEKESQGFILSRQRTGDAEQPVATYTTTPALQATNALSGASYQFIDRTPLQPGTYTYFLDEVALNGIRTRLASASLKSAPTTFALTQNYPNPFNPSTTVSYQLPAASEVSLRVFDVLGREVATLVNGRQEAGNYSVRFDASRLTSGTYFYRIQAGSFAETKRMLLVK